MVDERFQVTCFDNVLAVRIHGNPHGNCIHGNNVYADSIRFQFQ